MPLPLVVALCLIGPLLSASESLRAAALDAIDAALARREIAGVSWAGVATVEVVRLDRAGGALVTRLDRSEMSSPLARVDDAQLAEVLRAAGERGAEDVDAALVGAALVLHAGDQVRAIAMLDAATRLAGDIEGRFADLCRAHGLTPPPSRAERQAAARAARDQKKKDAAERTAEKKRKALERVNHAGRVLPPLPEFDVPISFGTPESDAILAALQIFPKDNPWNEDISVRPVHPDSDAIIAKVGAATKVHVDFGHNFIIVPPNQPKVDVRISLTSESDPGPWPFPDAAPIQGWPAWWEEPQTLDHVQRIGEGDRHVVLVDPVNMMLHEFFYVRRTDTGWQATCAANWDLTSNRQRPLEWTSADAAGLPIFPGVVRYDELARGKVEHAIRMTVAATRKEYIYPASHHASLNHHPHWPAMGQRFRLKASADLTGLGPQATAMATAMKTYGMIVADNGRDWDMPVAIDKRVDVDDLFGLHRFTGADLEMIVTTGPEEGPRAPGAR
ncbi:MAG TPA: hypothetical protein VEL07_06850 [Planctomycetota bacterium]|nr:hypothetical protein [Planctomycetota bacterium]